MKGGIPMSEDDEYFDMCTMCGQEGTCFDICISMYNDGNYQAMCWLCARRMTYQYQQKIQELEAVQNG